MPKKKRESASESDIRMLKISEISTNIGRAISAIKWIAVAYIAYQAMGSISGETTDANIVIQVLASAPTKNAIFLLAIVILGLWGVSERRLRYSKTQYLTGRIKELEEMIDPERTSSNLASSGATHPRDKAP